MAILMIVLFHLPNQFSIIYNPSIRLLLFQGVGLFVLASGYGLSISIAKSTRKVFLAKRFIAIFPTYLFVLIAIYLNIHFFKIYIGTVEPYELRSFLLHVPGIHVLSQKYFYSISPIFWYISLAIQYIILIAFLENSKFADKSFYALSVVGVSSVLLVGLSVFDGMNSFFRLAFIGVWLIPIMFGFFAARSDWKLKYVLAYSFFPSAAIYCLYVFTNRTFGLAAKDGYLETVLDVFSLTIPSVFIFALLVFLFTTKNMSSTVRGLSYLGKMSFEIFLVHISIMNFVFSRSLTLEKALLFYLVVLLIASFSLHHLVTKPINKITIKSL